MTIPAPHRCLIIGDPVAHSLSPRMHTAGYQSLGISDQFTFNHLRVSSDELPAFIASLRTTPIRGAACTMPHKEALVPLVDWIDPIAARIGAINTITCEAGKICGYNTDWLGIVNPLSQKTELTGRRALILGAGGAARAAIVGLLERQCSVTITNRSPEKAAALASRFSIDELDWSERCASSQWDIIINTTALGMHPFESESPLPDYQFHDRQIVFETVYFPRQTRLLQQAQGARTIEGVQMLLHQGLAQFKIFTGKEAPVEAMREALG